MISPPSVGPALTPKAATTVLKPRASPRWAAGKASVMIAILGAKRSAPPSPWKARAVTSQGREAAAPQSAEPKVKSPSPAIQTGLRPMRSDTRPNVRRVAAMTTR